LTVTDTDRESFRKVVQRDGDHKKPNAAQGTGLNSLRTQNEMLMRHVAIDQRERDRAKQNRRDHHRCGTRIAAEIGTGARQCRNDE
jgi:hypothetical protein